MFYFSARDHNHNDHDHNADHDLGGGGDDISDVIISSRLSFNTSQASSALSSILPHTFKVPERIPLVRVSSTRQTRRDRWRTWLSQLSLECSIPQYAKLSPLNTIGLLITRPRRDSLAMPVPSWVAELEEIDNRKGEHNEIGDESDQFVVVLSQHQMQNLGEYLLSQLP
ncbi:hypothetical protein EVAR_56303_1 [Eumeta japonica]|uniref:Uncharacterized protein n=1 Tax=Eumeta variegata TaxID=151549 RepID=A0A4C1Z3V3_EUMVA|nr:hypothetical protein EVAR_56303_1 [Eumeta japonica]